jgi:hypothetical protein
MKISSQISNIIDIFMDGSTTSQKFIKDKSEPDPSKLQRTIKAVSKDFTSFEMTWTGGLFKNVDPLKPLYLMTLPSWIPCLRVLTLRTETSWI